MDKSIKPYLAEFLGTFVLVLITAGAVCINQLAIQQGSPGPGLVGIALAAGIAYAVGLAVTAPISGGFLNPAITLTLWVLKRLDGLPTLAFMGLQLLGASLAGMILWATLPEVAAKNASLGTPHLAVTNWAVARETQLWLNFQGALAETGLAFVLTVVIFATMIDPRAPKLAGPVGTWLMPLWVGLAVTGTVLAGFSLTGASANPARWFGTWIWEFAVPWGAPMRDHLGYWVGPIVGALVGGGLYHGLVLAPQEEVHHGHGHVEHSDKTPVGAGSRAGK